MKKQAVVFIFIGMLLLTGGAYIAIYKINKSNKDKAALTRREEEQHTQREQFREEELAKESPQKQQYTIEDSAKENLLEAQRKKEELEKDRRLLIRYKKLLAETEVKLSAARIDSEDVNDFEFLRTTEEKKDDLKKEHKKIRKLEVLRDNTKAKIASLKAELKK